ncbi:MAG: hypothetical protein KDM81_14580 [Verrucomicrobiae bacterium]|nr:hypothetical protein [Verrucomicrobiae bacterium]
MNRQELGEVLLRYRPRTADGERPEVQAALELSRQDPELESCLQEHLAFNAAVRRSLRSIQAPPGLVGQIVSERVVAPGLGGVPRRLILAGCVVAVALVMFLGLQFWWPPPNVEGTFANFRSRMVRTALRGYAMDLESHSAPEVRQFLRDQAGIEDWDLPAELPDRQLLGCAILKWQNQPAGLVCYGRSDQPDLWLFTIAGTALPDAPTTEEPRAAEINRMNTLVWTKNGRTYLLVGEDSPEALRRYAGQAG